jgi:dynein heavy chain
VAVIFTDAEVKDEGFLEYINQALSTGEVANLFPKDELDMIVNDIRPIMKKQEPHAIDNWDNLYKFFLDRARNNLHIILCFSPVGDKFSTRARKFPGLVSQCTIDIFMPWPEEALRNVSDKFISDFEMATTPEIKALAITHMAAVHTLTGQGCASYLSRFRRHVYVTPKSYLSFIAGYKTLYSRKHAEVKVLADKINTGLKKLLEAGEQVGEMKIELQQKEVSLAEAQKVSAALLVEIQASTTKAEKKKGEVMEVKNKLYEQATRIGKDKAECEEDLSKAKPALEAAEAALSSITAKDINNIKGLNSPPRMVKVIFDGVLLLRQKKINKVVCIEDKGMLQFDDSYKEHAKPMMIKTDFLDSLLTYPKEKMNDEMVELLYPYTERPDFNYETAYKSAGAVAGLCNWVSAMVTYHNIAKFVAPKTDALLKAEKSLEVANKKLAAAMEDLAVCQAELDAMQAKFDAAKAEKQRLQDDADLTKRRMDAANALINGLSGEKTRWTQQSKEFADEISRLVGDCALACAFMSYLGPFNKEFRDEMQNGFYKDLQAKKIPVSSSLKITSFLTDEAETGEWNLQGLPADELSIQNGILVTRSSRWPILIDPQGQGISWISNKEANNQLKITAFYDKQFRFHLEDCLSMGKPLLIENLEEDVDPVLDPVLNKAFVKSGRGWKIALADKEVDYTETFLLFMTTKLPNPHYTPELSANVTVIDFTVTMKGLEDQLLGKVIAKEKSELQEQRQALLEEVNSYKKKIKELEDDLLRRLSESSGNLLDDASLIDVLAVTKKTSQEVGEKLVNANETEARIFTACEEFRPVATRGSVIYFLISEMRLVDHMYQTALTQFMALFNQAIDDSEKSNVPAKRINAIIELLTHMTFLYMCRGLFERDKLLYTLLLALKIQMTAGVLTQDHFNCLLKGGAALEISAVRKKPKEWIADMSWLHIVNLGNTLPVFRDLPDSLFRSEGIWKQWYDQEAPEMTKIPEFEEKLDKFGRLLVVRSLREDRTILAANEYIADTLGQKYIESTPLNLETTWAESNERCPLICLLSPGVLCMGRVHFQVSCVQGPTQPT